MQASYYIYFEPMFKPRQTRDVKRQMPGQRIALVPEGNAGRCDNALTGVGHRVSDCIETVTISVTSEDLPQTSEQVIRFAEAWSQPRDLWWHGMPLEPLSEAHIRFGRLSSKERELLDHILQHKSLKVIAHDLGVTLSAVDQRLKSARIKLGATDRNDAARIYSALLASCRESTCGFADLVTDRNSQVILSLEPPSGSTFTFQDSATIDVVPPWFERQHRGAVSEVLDEKFGRLWRVIAIPVFAVTIATLALALMAMAKSLSELL